MAKFIKKPVVIEAVQWNGNSNKKEIEEFVGTELKSELESETAYVAGKGAPIFSLLIETKEGTMKAFMGDWIIKEAFPTGDRDFYPCKPDIFKNTYEVVEDFSLLLKTKNHKQIMEETVKYNGLPYSDLIDPISVKKQEIDKQARIQCVEWALRTSLTVEDAIQEATKYYNFITNNETK